MYSRLVSIFILVLLMLFPVPAEAAKIRVRKPRAAKPATSFSSVSVSPNTHSLHLSFQNLSKVSSVTYELSYSSWDIPQGAMGSLTVSGQSSDSRDLYFGTCSHGVCTPHYGLGAKAYLMVCADLTNGTQWCKRYTVGTKRLQ